MFWDVVRDIACQKRRAQHIVWHQMCCVELFVCRFLMGCRPFPDSGLCLAVPII